MHSLPTRESPPPPARLGVFQAIVSHGATAWAVLLVCLVVTFVIWRGAADAVEQRAAERFRAEVDRAEFVIGRRMLVFERMLSGVHGLLDAETQTTHESWGKYVAALRLPAYYPAVRGVGFIRWVPASGKARFEARMRGDGLPELTITPPGDRDAYAVVEFLYPLDASNRRALGYDAWSEPRRREALALARDTGFPTLTQGLVLVAQQGTSSQQPAVIMFVPQYRAGQPTGTPELRSAALEGWVYSPLLMDDMMRDLLPVFPQGIGLQLFDDVGAAPGSLLFDTDSAAQTPGAYGASARADARRIRHAGRTWLLRARARPVFEAQTASRQPTIIAVGGLVLDGALFALFWSLARLRQRAEALAEEMTESSRRTVKALEREFIERGQAETALREAEVELRSDAAFRRAVIEQVSEGLCVCHVVAEFPHLMFTVWNARMAEITGYTLDEINRLGWYEVMYPDADARARAAARMTALLRGEGFGTAEREITCADGEKRLLAVSARLLDGADGHVHLLSLMRDITEQRRAESQLRESEQRFREIAENIQEVFWVRPESLTTVSYVSPAYQSIWGRTSETLYGNADGWLNAVHPDDQDQVRDLFLTKPDSGECEYRIVRPDGSVRWIRDRAFPIRDITGGLVRVVGVAEDITARKLADDERETLDLRLRQGQKMEAIGTLAGGIAHDFNNILGAIIANVDLAQEDVGPGHPALESLDQIVQSSQRAASLVQQILAFSRKRPQEMRLVQLRAAVEGAVRLLRAPIPASVELRTSFTGEIPSIIADPTEIDQVLMNLCTNAWQALEGRPGDIHVALDGVEFDDESSRSHADLRPGLYARLTVSDTGKGMDAHTRERIFDPFFTTKDVGKGTGLGLSVVHGIVTNLRGAIRVVSQPGLGTTFEIYLPAAGPESSSASIEVASQPDHAGLGQRVLFLDDEEALVNVGVRMLQRRGYEATGFTRPSDALRALRKCPLAFDVVVADYNMPGASGIDVAREIRRNGYPVGLVLASGLMTEALRSEAAGVGFEHVLYKPYSADDLFDAVQGALASARRVA